MHDPEAQFQQGWLLCDAGEHEVGLGFLRKAIDKGYALSVTLAASRSFDAVRNDPAFQRLVADAEADRALALAAFRENGGERLLGL